MRVEECLACEEVHDLAEVVHLRAGERKVRNAGCLLRVDVKKTSESG